ncbi:hypothetical protein CHS0354_025663 [Potamilus streckersoni]|uniref:Uncharacterized protein n=1 Tax=Potamilus streckersoni TaxID=2493646 RepID=A0AAE0RYQ7_9BIVA|nr:hypothetical protein CHS0354_025663 [Potamilus streckersoni]
MTTKSAKVAMMTSTNDSDIDRYLQESSKSYRECQIKNNARRNSLQKRTLGIETERRMASAELDREEKALREQFQSMQIDKMKHAILHHKRAAAMQKSDIVEEEPEPVHLVIPIEPYPITMGKGTPPKSAENEYVRLYTTKGRRQSKELEDLKLDTKTGTFVTAISHYDDELLPRRRVASMSHAMKPGFRKRLNSGSGSSSARTTPGTSPSQNRKHLLSSRRGKGYSNNSSPTRSSENLSSSLEDSHWLGDPNAIHSVRRPRKTVEQLELEHELHRL